MTSFLKQEISTILLACSLLFFLTACSNKEDGDEGQVSEKREVSSFSRVIMAGIGDLIIHQGEREEIQLNGDPQLLSSIKTQVTNETLYIEEKPAGWLQGIRSHQNSFMVHLYLKNVEEITLSGRGKITSDHPLKSPRLAINISGSGKVELSIESDIFSASITGSGVYDLKGKANNQSIQISGKGDYDAKELITDHTSVDIRGTGKVEVDAQKELNIIITGSGVVRYLGSPEITQKIFGKGKIKKIKEALTKLK